MGDNTRVVVDRQWATVDPLGQGLGTGRGAVDIGRLIPSVVPQVKVADDEEREGGLLGLLGMCSLYRG